jgi:hypothetical protein
MSKFENPFLSYMLTRKEEMQLKGEELGKDFNRMITNEWKQLSAE